MAGRLALPWRRQNGGAADGGSLPLPERILGGLPGSRVVWQLAWAAIPVAAALIPGSYLATVGAKPLPVRAVTGAVYGYAVALAVWATSRFTAEISAVERSVDRLAERSEEPAPPAFRSMTSTLGPLVLTLAFVAVTFWRTAVLGGGPAALLWLPVSFVVNLPLLTAVWVFLVVLLGLNRLGRRALSLRAFPEDLSLGLGEVGRLAFTAFSVYAAGFAPVLVVNLGNPLRLAMTLGLFLLGVLAFFGSLGGLHRQLLAARRHYLEWVGNLYARAYEPVRSGSLAALGEQAQLLQAAEVIQRRAEAIQRWPFEERRLAQIAAIVGTVVTFVVTGIITRVILLRLGL